MLRPSRHSVTRRDATRHRTGTGKGNHDVKRIAATVIFFVAGQLPAAGASAGSPAPQRLGRPSTTAPDVRGPQADRAAGAGEAIALNEGFEQVDRFGADGAGGGIFSNGWIRRNNSDKANGYWMQCLPTSQNGVWNAADGPDNSCALSSYGATMQDHGTISDWIVSPLVNFGAGSTVSFHTRTKPGSQFPDRLQVRACVSGPCTNFGTGAEDVGDFTTVLFDLNPGEAQSVYPEDWTQYTLAFADGVPTSGSGRIAFRYYVHDGGVNGTRGNLVGLDRVVVDSGQGSTSLLGLDVTVAPADAAHPDACATTTSIDVAVGDQVNYCYKVTNHSSETLNYQFLRDDRLGPLITQQPTVLAPGASYQYNRIVTVGEAQSPSSTWTGQVGPWGYTYAVSPPPSHFIDITDGTLIAADSGASAVLTFPADFDFLLYGQRIRQFCVLTQGIFESVTQSCASNFMFGNLPNDHFLGNPSIIPFWINVVESPGGGNLLYWKTLGTAPNRQFIVEWKDVETMFDGPVTMEVILNEGSNVIEMRYAGDYSNTAQYYRTGLQNQWIANVYPDNGNLLNVGSIVWTPADPNAHTATRKVTVNAGLPALDLNPTAVTATAPSQGTASAVVTVANPGNGRLDWSVQTAARPSNMPSTPHFVVPLGAREQVSFGRLPAWLRSTAVAPASPTPAAPAGNGQYAYAVDLNEGPYLWKFDPNHTDDKSIAGYLPSYSSVTGATFLDDDFTKLYAFDTFNNQLFWFDVTSQYAAMHVVGTAAVPTDAVMGLKQDPTSGAVYLSTADGRSSGLWTIDPDTAVVQQIGSTSDAPGIIDIAFDAQGNLYGVDILLDALVAIDKTSGTAQPIGSLGFDANYASGLAFDYATGQLYFSSVDISGGFLAPGIWTIDTITGQATLASPINGIDGATAVWDAFAIAHPADNVCVDPANVPWLVLSPQQGTIAAGAAPATVSLAFDGTALADGTYSANLCLYSNDPLHRHQSLPVTFTVGVSDTIFADGFDSTAF